MTNNISLSLKKTLRIALPCLALSLFSVSCSEDDSAVLPENTTKGRTISFTAVASEITEDYATRVGLDKDEISSSDLAPEPIIWLLGDKFAYNFVKYGEVTGQIIEFTATAVSDGGLGCTMTADIDLENGLYQVYVLTPNTSGVFQRDDVSKTTIDLRGQSQPGGTADYSNLGDYYYQSAYTVLEIKDNEVVTGSTNLKFTALTSMLRYQITSNLANEVTVKKIKIEHSGDSPYQFYTRGYFDPSTGTSVVPAGDAIPTLSMLTNESLEPSSAFNAYMTLLPTESFASGDYNILSVTVYFDQGGTLYQRAWSWNASGVSNNGKFPAASRFMFNLTLRPAEISLANPNALNDLEEEVIIESVTISTGSYDVNIGETLDLDATINPVGAVGTIVWASSDESVATVDQNGVVTGISEGSASISATVGGTEIKSSLTVIVTSSNTLMNKITHDGYIYAVLTENSDPVLVNNPFDASCPEGWSLLTYTDVENKPDFIASLLNDLPNEYYGYIRDNVLYTPELVFLGRSEISMYAISKQGLTETWFKYRNSLLKVICRRAI